jgi:teichoic acid transport system permease protein
MLEFLSWANPVSVYLTLGRAAMVTGYSADSTLWIAGSAWALGTLLVGFVFFWRAEERYGRVA